MRDALVSVLSAAFVPPLIAVFTVLVAQTHLERLHPSRRQGFPGRGSVEGSPWSRVTFVLTNMPSMEITANKRRQDNRLVHHSWPTTKTMSINAGLGLMLGAQAKLERDLFVWKAGLWIVELKWRFIMDCWLGVVEYHHCSARLHVLHKRMSVN